MDFCCVTVNLPDVPLPLCSILAIPPSLAINFQYPSFFLYMNNLVDKTRQLMSSLILIFIVFLEGTVTNLAI